MAGKPNQDDPYGLNGTTSLYDQTFGDASNPATATSNGGITGGALPNPMAGSTVSTGSTTEPGKIENPAAAPGFAPTPNPTPTPPPTSSQSNQDRFLSMMNDPANQGKSAQQLIDQFNGLNLNADASGLSSMYGSSPAYYQGNNTIGLPGAYLVQDPNTKQWKAVPRSPESGSSGPAPIQSLGVPNVQDLNLAQSSTIAPSYAAPAPAAPSFAPTAPKYTPGDISLTDIPNFSYDQMMSDATAANANPVVQANDKLTTDLLNNPQSMSPQVVGQMEAASKDQIAEQQAQQDQAAKEMGASYGISDSPWLASERLAAQREANANIVGQNRNIETTAAQTNMADKRAAAQIGAAAAAQKTQAQQAAVQLASNTTLQAAAARGDRMALREQVNQAATQLGLSADQLTLQYALAVMQNETAQRGQTFNKQVAEEQLAQGGREFQENLIFEYAQLNQADQHFGASYGLQAAELQNNMNNSAYSHYASTFGG